MIGRRPLAAGLSLLLLAACSTSTRGSPVPGSQNTGESSTATTTTGAVPSSTAHLLPPRPRDLDLTGVDPCKDVLTSAQLHQLAYDLGYERPPLAGNVYLDDGRACGYSSSRPTDQPSRDIGSLVGIVTTVGADVWLTDKQNRANTIRQTTVEQFPALVVPHPNFKDVCEVVVDVHDGQYLSVQSSPTRGTGTSPDPYCTEAQRVAEMAIQNLLARR